MGMPKICKGGFGLFVGIGFGLEGLGSHTITVHVNSNKLEYWAEAETAGACKGLYTPTEPPPSGRIYRTTKAQRDYMIRVFRGP